MGIGLSAARSILGTRRVTAVLLVMLIAVAVGLPVGGLAGARRTSGVLDRFRAASAAADVSISLPEDASPAQLERFAALPGVVEMGQLMILLVRPAGSGLRPGAEFVAIAPVGERVLRTIDRPLIVRGSPADPDRADEVVVDEGFASENHVGPGDRFEIESMAPRQIGLMTSGQDPGPPSGPRVSLRVAGVARFTFDAHTAGGPRQTFATTPAFLRAFGDEVAVFPGPHRVRLGSDIEVSAFVEQVRGLFPSGASVDVETADQEQSRVEDAIRLQTSALVAFSLIAGAAALVACVTILLRLCTVGAVDDQTRRSFGCTQRTRVLVLVLPGAALAALAVALGALVAIASSLAVPFGLARRVEPDPGLHVDLLVVAPACVGVLAVFLACLTLKAWRLTSSAGIGDAVRPGTVAGWLAAHGAPLSVSTGSQLAFGRRSSLNRVRPSVVGLVVGLAGIVAALTLAASVNRVLVSPPRYGVPYDFEAMADGDPSELAARLAADDEIDALTVALIGEVRIAGRHEVQAWAVSPLKGRALFTVLSGRLPQGPDEVALGPSTQGGGRVEIDGPEASGPFTVVGHVLFPVSQSESFSDGVVLTAAAIEHLGAVRGGTVLASWRASADAAVVLARVHEEGVAAVTPSRPPQIDNLDEVDVIVRVLAGLLGLLAAASLLHVIVTTVRRQRHDLAVLRVLGFGSRELRRTVMTQAVVLLAIGATLGLPLGVAAGSWAWRLVARRLEVAGDALIPAGATIVTMAAMLATAAIAGMILSFVVNRTDTATGVRTE